MHIGERVVRWDTEFSTYTERVIGESLYRFIRVKTSADAIARTKVSKIEVQRVPLDDMRGGKMIHYFK
jgi:hypothetical protein